MTKQADDQLEKWVLGDSQHNKEDDECCPDFSCCKPELLAPEYERKAFAGATEQERTHMLGGFLGRAFANHKVHIAGDHGTEQ